ncbi:MAG: hypothetical protein H6738_03760 [Alphaproteobacteria bacterium]|nr:hypothetical protein [Alphaproteobacteria bacterium]MCB9695885.1 hypothetical protein [Alphaproteobacteria bacterium]
MSRLARGETEVRWARGALIVRHPTATVLVDVPPGIEAELGEALGDLSAVILTSGRIRTTTGLLGLLAALEPHRDPERPLRLHVPWGEERGAALADTWSRLWPGRFPVEVDAERAGALIEVGSIAITTHAIRAGEPHWQLGTVETVPAVALTIRTPDLTVAVLPSCTPSAGGQRLCNGVDLAVVEVAAAPWPRIGEGQPVWRATPDRAIELVSGAREAWLVGDDGRWLGDDRPV